MLVTLVMASLLLGSTARVELAVLLTFPALIAGRVLAGSWGAFQESGRFPDLQGRYLFPTVAVLLTAAALTLVVWSRWPGYRIQAQLPTLLAALGAASTAYALVFFFRAAYQAADETVVDALARWAAWSLLPRPLLGAAVLLPAAFTAASLAVLARESRSFDPADTADLVHARSSTREPEDVPRV